MVKETQFYDLLDVSPDASDADLKKAYHQKALRLHPDQGGDPELFKEVTHAYEVLSDPEKRSIYDVRGKAGLSEQGGMGGTDPQDIFSQLFGGGRRSPPQRTGDLVHRVHVSLEDLYEGKTTKLALTRNTICKECKGKGGKGSAVQTCKACNGRGFRVTMRQMGSTIRQFKHPCVECSGTGEIINLKNRCSTCKGKTVVTDKRMLKVHIDKGIKGGQTVQFPGESDEAPGAEPGDVILVIEEKLHDRLKCHENDLIIDFKIDLLTALAGGQFAIKHLDDRALLVHLEPGEVIKNGDLQVIYGQGMPLASQRHHEPGDMYVKLDVIFPESIDIDKIPLLEQTLPPRQPHEGFEKNVLVEEVRLNGTDNRHKGIVTDDHMDEDSDEPRVQCANQ